ncbi:hypothetical protein GS682_04975 [Nostoc sp. B(2019)]|nr:hypothetical protein [Nostoc sp. B(2019)]
MITPPIRDELRRIQAELKKPFPANLHEVRELPGSNKKWVFLRWQTIRKRLDEIAPDWMSDYSEIQYIGNDAICRCGITILGIRKEAIASVPISLQSKAGNEMTRGSAADRLAAEGLKNAAETWGVGRYLDDQEYTIKYLWENKHKLSDQMNGELRRLCEQYKVQMKTIQLSAVQAITQEQAKRLWAIARNECKLSESEVKTIFTEFKVESTTDILVSQYDKVIERIKNFNPKF